MCSNNDECGSDELMETKKNFTLIGGKCKKCKDDQVPADVLLRGKDMYCRSCLLNSVSHKFRAALGKSKMVKPGDKILIGFSGSQASVALLNLVKEGLAEDSHKKFLFQPYIVYIDEGISLDMSLKDRRDIIEEIRNVLNYYSFPSYISILRKFTLPVSADSYICYPCNNNLELNESDDRTLQEMFSTIDLSSKEDLLQKLRQNILINMADRLGCSKIFSAETSDDLAVKLLSNISLGRGSQLFFDVGFCDTRDSHIRILRPMKDLTKKEIAMYSVFSKLESVHVPSFRTYVDERASIQKLTEKFVTELQNDFPATSSTVFRTGEKLSSSCNMKELKKCVLCKAPVDTFEVASSSLQATNFSQLVSKSQIENFVPVGKFGKDADSCTETENYNHSTSDQQTNGLSSQDCKKLLCYGCWIIFKDMEVDTFLLESEGEEHRRCMNEKSEVFSNCIL